jgi:hypothetical protein
MFNGDLLSRVPQCRTKKNHLAQNRALLKRGLLSKPQKARHMCTLFCFRPITRHIKSPY